jgi:hypothetical protein
VPGADFTTLNRTIKRSGLYYAKVIESRGATLDDRA